ncbi:hypothetical protein [Nostoc sp. ChiQUE01b]|nr:hypothetical protein [Nostoc sp. ChiQUE01b]MDZ8259126.1 hypothetical protein [Nostoc sp. ChiQUE01b]
MFIYVIIEICVDGAIADNGKLLGQYSFRRGGFDPPLRKLTTLIERECVS